jgi:hypothetical protein
MDTATAGIDPVLWTRLADPTIRRFLNDHWAGIEEKFSPNHFILFGSRIYGIPHEWSDIDAIIVSGVFAKTPRVNRSATFKRAIDLRLPMDVLCYTPEEFEDMRTGIGVVPDACREGVWLK